MLKVLQVINSLSSGGAEVFVTQLVKALSRNCEVRLLTYAGELDEKGTSLRKHLEDNNIEYISLNAHSTVKRLAAPLRIASFIQRWKPDVVHAHLPRSEQFVFLSSLLTVHKYKAIRTKHDERLYSAFFLNRLMNRFYDRNIACSVSAFHALQEMGLSDRSVVVKNGIDIGMTDAMDATERSRIRSAIGIREDKIMCLNIGRMELEKTGFQKAQDLILAALAQGGLSSVCHVVFLGCGSGRDTLRDQAEKLGVSASVSFKGVVSNVLDYVASTDILVMPSRWEGLPIAAIEVACSGVPMILSNISSFDEFYPESVVKCEAESVDSLIAAIQDAFDRLSLLKSEAQKLALQYKRQFAIEHVAERHIELYEQVLSSSWQ